MDAAATTRKQVVLYPAPGLGHLVSMAELSKILAAHGLAVTIVIIKPSYDTDATGPFLADVTAVNPSISFHCLPRVELMPVDSVHPEAVTFEAARTSSSQLRDFLDGASPAILVVDFFCSVAVDVATELSIPAYCFFT